MSRKKRTRGEKQQLAKTTGRKKYAGARRGLPIAKRLIRKMKKMVAAKVVDLESVIVGRTNAEKLQKTVASPDELAGFNPAHAAYVYAQNQVSVMSEQLTGLDEMARFVNIISRAEDEYMPSGPPMSPLTTSFFTCWAFFDVCVGLSKETIGTTVMAVGAAFGMHEELTRVMGLMQQSRMGVYVYEGAEGDLAVLRELVTGEVCRAVVPTGYHGERGELWYVRVLPPPLPGSEHVVFTTPYVLYDRPWFDPFAQPAATSPEPAEDRRVVLPPGKREWQAYFRRTLHDGPPEERIARYEHHMKYGPTRDYWTEFVFEAYVNHRTEVIFLAGLPDVAESRPHSRVNSR